MPNSETEKILLSAQKNEITEYHIYKRLAKSAKDPNNKAILEQIANEELKHYNLGKEYSKHEVDPSRLNIWKYRLISGIFGLTFALKLMENGERGAQREYEKLTETFPETKEILRDEEEHERELIDLIDEERLRYVGSIVLGLNDAIVELTGALAGLTFALQNTRLTAIAGLITGIAASLSMATSEYLSTKSEGGSKNPLKAAVYTGTAYVVAVLFLIVHYFVFANPFLCLGLTILNAVIVIFVFTFYISVAKETPFKNRFSEMVLISLGIAALTFIIGFVISMFLNIEP